MLQMQFSTRLKILAEIQPQNHQNGQKMHFWQKAPGVNGLMKGVSFLKNCGELCQWGVLQDDLVLSTGLIM